MQNSFNLPAELQKINIDERECTKATPSYHVLETLALNLVDLVKKWKEINPQISTELYFIQRKIEIFKVDLPGYLKQDLQRGNKRYRNTWIGLKENADSIKQELLAIWNNNKTND